MQHLNIFLSSPGDVSRERQLAREVIDQIQSERLYRNHFKLEVVAWDKPGAGTAMSAHLEPQEAIDRGLKKPSHCDIIVVIFWARMGTILSEKYLKPDGSRYRSGTEYEFIEALKAAERTGKPEVLVYRRIKPPDVNLADPQREEKEKQWDLVEEFFAEFRNPDGSYQRFFKAYDEPSDFKDLLEQDVRDRITQYLEVQTSDKIEAPITIDGSTWEDSPFPGLRAFTPEEALIFFGRGREIDELISKLSGPECRLIALVGASGTGKSSLVSAGVVPALEKNAIHGSEDWVWLRFTPGEVGDNPFMAFANAFKPTIERHSQLARDVAKNLETDTSKLKELLAMALEGKPEWAEVLILIDQFEEFFSLVDSKYQDAFVNLLELASKTARLRTVVTMRADFYHRCLEWPVLGRLLAEGHYPLLVPKMGALNEMINRPAERAGLQFEEGLAQRILDDTGTEPGALALMAFALFELWNESKEASGTLTYDAYESFNGVHGAVGKRAEDTFKDLEGEKTELEAALARVFWELVEVDERGVATRRRARLSQITDGTAAETLVRAMTDARLLVTSREERGDAVVEVAHEAIFTNWPRLSRWIDDHTGELRTWRRLIRAARDWQDTGSPRFSHLPDRATLKEYRKVRPTCSLSEDVEVVGRFLGAAKRRQAIWSGFLSLILIIVSILGVDVWRRSREMNLNVFGMWALAQLRLYEGPQMVKIPGTAKPFQMGSYDCAESDESDACPQHPVTIQPFWIGKFEVTFDEYIAFLKDTNGVKLPDDWDFGHGSRPVISISWEDAKAYTDWLSNVTGKSFRLPTEAEWEYAARAGTTTHYWWGDDVKKDGKIWANCADSGSRWSGEETAPVGSFSKNGFGLYDMHGNVWEWCADWYDDDYYKSSPSDNPKGPKGGKGHVIRSGSWNDPAKGSRSAYRSFGTVGFVYFDVGFRVARSVALGP